MEKRIELKLWIALALVITLVMLSVSAFGQLDITKRNVTATQGLKAGTQLVIDNDTVFAIQADTTGIYAVNGRYFLCTVKTLKDYVAAHSGGNVTNDSTWSVATVLDTLKISNIGKLYKYLGGLVIEAGANSITLDNNEGDQLFIESDGGIQLTSDMDYDGAVKLTTTLETSTIHMDIGTTDGNIEYKFEHDTLRADSVHAVLNSITVTDSYNMDSLNFPYIIFFQADGADPVDDQTVYFCSTPQVPAINENTRAVVILQDGVITRACLIMNTTSGNAGTNEAISLYIRVNHADDYLIKTLSSTSGTRIFDNYSLSIPVTQGDIIEMKVDPGTWATNPTGVHWSGNILIR